MRQKISDVLEFDTALMVHYFDSDNDKRLTYGGFLSMLLPCENPELRAKVSQIDSKSTEISLEVERALVELLDAEVALQRETEAVRLDLAHEPGFDAGKVYEEMILYSGRTDSIDRRGLELYLCAKGYTPD